VQLPVLAPAANVLAAQSVHTDDPAAENLPAPQSEHVEASEAPRAALAVPAGQRSHSPLVFAAAYSPVPHWSHTNSRPSGSIRLLNPARQKQPPMLVPPSDVLLPGHASHALSPSSEYLPAAQGVHTDAPLPLELPAGHSRHVVSSVAFCAGEYFPPTQDEHVSGLPSRGSESYVPAAQGVHDPARAAAKNPA